MATKATDAATDVTPAATASAEPVVATPEPTQKTDAIENQLTELKGKLVEYETLQESLKKDKNEALAERLRYEAMYKGLQNQTTRTLQEAAKNRKELEQALKDRAELTSIRETMASQNTILETLANRVLDADEVKELSYKQRESQLKQREQALSARTAPIEEPEPIPASSQQEAALEFDKAQFVNFYFPGMEVDPEDSRIDWANDVTNTQEAFARFTRSMIKIKDEQDQTKTQDIVNQLKSQSAEALKLIEQQNQELATQNAAELERAKAEAIVNARKDAEKRLRQLGADVEGTPLADGARRTLNQQLNEELDDSLLYTNPKEYSRRVEAVKKQVREQR